MIGLLLGLVLRVAGTEVGDFILDEGVAAGVRCVFWFGAFALLDQNPWTDRKITIALGAGVAATLLTLMATGGIGSPSVATSLWLAIALASNAAAAQPAVWASRHQAVLALTAPLLFAGALLYFLNVLLPVSSSLGYLHQARFWGNYYAQDLLRPARERNIKKRAVFLGQFVIPPLELARNEDPDNSQVWLALAHWQYQLWAVNTEKLLEEGTRSLMYVSQARQLDPEGRDPYQASYDLHLFFAYTIEKRDPAILVGLGLGVTAPIALAGLEEKVPALAVNRKKAAEQFRLAAEALTLYRDRDPTDANLRYQVALAWYKAGLPERGRPEAEAALDLDDQGAQNRRRLTDAQRQQVRHWLQASSPGSGS
jgi:hypothetical protein